MVHPSVVSCVPSQKTLEAPPWRTDGGGKQMADSENRREKQLGVTGNAEGLGFQPCQEDMVTGSLGGQRPRK